MDNSGARVRTAALRKTSSDARDPRGEVATREHFWTRPYLQKYGLRDIFSLLAIAEHSFCDAEYERAMPVVERSERIVIAFGYTLDQRRIVSRHAGIFARPGVAASD